MGRFPPSVNSTFNALRNAIGKALNILGYKNLIFIFLKDERVLTKLRNKIDGERPLHKQPMTTNLSYTSYYMYTPAGITEERPVTSNLVSTWLACARR